MGLSEDGCMEFSNVVKQTWIGLPSGLIVLENDWEWKAVLIHVSNDIPQLAVLGVSMVIMERNQQGN